MTAAAEPRTVLQTERLRLREFCLDDAEFMVELLNDDDFLRYIGDRGVRTVEDAREYIRLGPVASYERDGIGIWLVIRIEDSRLVGTCGLLRRDELDAPDVGFAFLPDYRSQGYGYESARAVLDHATTTLDIDRVLGVTQHDNAASIGLLEKLGLRYEDVVRLDSKGPDLAMYSTAPRRPEPAGTSTETGDDHLAQELRYFVVDAFTSEVFRGNPAGVVILQSPLADATLQAIAAENNLAETAFLTGDGDGYGLRWFTPTEEVPLCGHATLATAHAIFRHLEPDGQVVEFATASGPIVVRADGAWLELDLPRFDAEPVGVPPAALVEGLGMALLDVRRVDADPNYYVRLNDEQELLELRPDLDTLAELHPHGVAVTAPGTDVDFVSRYFAPGSGIPEDPVTGSSHAVLTPYWAARLGRDSLIARQLSPRGGELRCRLDGDRVRVAGQAAQYLQGTINVPAHPGETP